MPNWTDSEPGHANLGQLDTAATDLLARATAASQVATSVSSEVHAVGAEQWTGTASDVWRTEGLAAAARAQQIADVLHPIHAALGGYRAEVARIAGAALVWNDEIRAANWIILNYVPPSPDFIGPVVSPVPAAQDRIDHARRQLSYLADDRRSADDSLVAAVHAALPADWPAQWDALQSICLTTPEQLSDPAVAEQMMADIARRLIASSEDASLVDELTVLYDLYGEDEEIMAGLYLELGGADTLALTAEVAALQGAGFITTATAMQLAGSIRSGLAVGSSRFTIQQSQELSADMVNAVGYAANVGFLFADPENALMDETFVVAMANAIEAQELESGVAFLAGIDHNGGARLTSMFDPQTGIQVYDPSGVVFVSLAQYPDAAFDWLTSGDIDRVQYWYADRYETGGFENYDMFDGVSALWAGALHTEGGLYDTDSDLNEQASAQLSSHVINALVGNDWFNPDIPPADGPLLTTDAAHQFAAAFLAHSSAFGEYPLSDDDVAGADGAFVFTALTGEEFYGPAVLNSALGEFLGQLGGHPDGLAALDVGITAYRDTMLLAAQLSGDANHMEAALISAAHLQGLFEGSLTDANIDFAAASDEAREAARETLSTVLGVLPITWLPPIETGAGFVIDWSLDVIRDQVESALDDWLVDAGINLFSSESLPTALEQASAAQATGENTAERMAAEWAYGLLEANQALPADLVGIAGEFSEEELEAIEDAMRQYLGADWEIRDIGEAYLNAFERVQD